MSLSWLWECGRSVQASLCPHNKHPPDTTASSIKSSLALFVFIIDWLMMVANASCGAKFMLSCSPVAKGRELERLTVGLRDVGGVRRPGSVEGVANIWKIIP